MKTNYTKPEIEISKVSASDIMLGSDTDIDVGGLFSDEEDK